MEYIIVNVFSSAAQEQFDMRIPCDINVMAGAKMVAKAFSALCEEDYLPSRTSFLADRKTGRMLDPGKTFRECSVINGSHLLLI